MCRSRLFRRHMPARCCQDPPSGTGRSTASPLFLLSEPSIIHRHRFPFFNINTIVNGTCISSVFRPTRDSRQDLPRRRLARILPWVGTDNIWLPPHLGHLFHRLRQLQRHPVCSSSSVQGEFVLFAGFPHPHPERNDCRCCIHHLHQSPVGRQDAIHAPERQRYRWSETVQTYRRRFRPNLPQ